MPAATTLKRIVRRSHRFLTSSRKASLIFVYHRVAEPAADPWALCVSPEHFDEQLALLKRIADPVPLNTIVCARSSKELPARPVGITFDDGYKDNLLNATPILEKHGLHATVFVSSGFIDATAEVWSDELARLILLSDQDARVLASKLHLEPDPSLPSARSHQPWYSWEAPREIRHWIYRALYEKLLLLTPAQRDSTLEEVRQWSDMADKLERAGWLTSSELSRLAQSASIEIGGHSFTHPVLSGLCHEEQQQEVRRNKEHLEAATGCRIRHFAYPYGKKDHFNADTVKAVQSSGMQSACANYGRLVTSRSDRMAMPRFQIHNWNAAQLEQHMRAWYRGDY